MPEAKFWDHPDIGDYFMHFGTPRHSGRYPWGSGENPYQSDPFLSKINQMKSEGKKETEIAEAMNMSTTRLRSQIQIKKSQIRADLVQQAKSLKSDGLNTSEIARRMGFANESSVRSLLNTDSERRMKISESTAKTLKEVCDERGMIDVGAGVDRELGISPQKMTEALDILKAQGYEVYGGRIPQVTNPGKMTTIKVLCPPGTEHKEIFNTNNIHSINDYTSHDDGETFEKLKAPTSVSSDRVAIRYAEDGGIEKDGVIELRRGVADLDLGASHYAQVRIMVDGSHYLKGMAVYSDNLPDGVDIMFNTNKGKKTSKMDVLKPLKTTKDENGNTIIDKENPFGALIKANGQSEYIDPKTGEKKLSPVNKVREEGDWDEWAKKIPSQFLAKQNKELARKQLNLTVADAQAEFDTIMNMTNPTVKKKLLMSFANSCDSDAVHLKAAALPRQRYQVILPMTTAKATEIYAPNYNDGEKVALVRYPHGGTFEIPILTVNNKLAEGNRVITRSGKDAVGINSDVAERLSGADFDGDTVMVIPCKKVKITSSEPLKGLVGFDPKLEYGADSKDPVKTIKDSNGKEKEYYTRNGKIFQRMANTQNEMGKISNLITDMTIKGATPDELARAVRHSMVVIDAEKHKLDYKQSYADNGIAALKTKYQGHIDPVTGRYSEGAGTLLSMAKSETSVTKRRGSAKINMPDSPDYNPNKPIGSLIWKTDPDATYVDKKTGKTITRTQASTKMAETDDARTLSSGYDIENIYADYANKMKYLANEARKEYMLTRDTPYSPTAKKTYAAEVESLDRKLNDARLNAPRERKAQLMANTIVNKKKAMDPDLTKKDLKKLSQKALTQARTEVGAQRTAIEFTDREWEAIQAGAITHTKLEQILDSADMDSVKEKAMPRFSMEISDAQKARIKAMSDAGYTNAEIAKRLGKSTSTVSKYINA